MWMCFRLQGGNLHLPASGSRDRAAFSRALLIDGGTVGALYGGLRRALLHAVLATRERP